MQIETIYFLPPLAIARLGGSSKPLDCFVWDSDKSIHGGNRTVIRPTTSLRVLPDGSLRPYLPNVIQFRDDDLLRPVAPFFELWAVVADEGKTPQHYPLTLKMLESLDAGLESIAYTITVGNRKAQRRTGMAACAYLASVSAIGNDHERKPLKAFSPHNPGEEPLVARDRPIPLGHFQVIRPIRHMAMGIDLSVLRVRFTPATGQVYGPQTAIAGPASPLPPGEALPAVTLGGRLHDIVPKDNRILNLNTKWSEYAMNADGQEDPQPSDSYDGANVGDNRSWGVVDDTCDGIIEARLVIGSSRYIARARVLSSCPDYAPDRRPFYSLADDLADRDEKSVIVAEKTKEQTEREIADLFERAYETASLINLDASRRRGIAENLGEASRADFRSAPRINYLSMTAGDKGSRKPFYADVTAELFKAPRGNANVPPEPPPTSQDVDPVPYSTAARFVHGPLCDVNTLLDKLVSQYDRIKQLIRPPFNRFSRLPRVKRSNRRFRDPRVGRDRLHDMRMPPFLRDSDLAPLSITFRQYEALIKLMDLRKRELEKSGKTGGTNPTVRARAIGRTVKRRPQLRKKPRRNPRN